MKRSLTTLILALCCVTACNKSAPPGPVAHSSPPSSANDSVVQKLEQYAGNSATNCGRLEVQASATEAKTASECAMEASQGKKPFYVAYDMPGMSVGVAGNSVGKLFTVQSQNGAVTSGDCPAQLRVASSGRITCFAPGDMGSMSGSHAAGSVTPGMANPHGASSKPPSN